MVTVTNIDEAPSRATLGVLRVGLIGMEERTRYLLDIYFKQISKSGYVLSSEHEADLYLIDLDSPGSRVKLQQQLARYPQRPVIAQSTTRVNNTGAILIKKPVKFADLKNALRQAQHSIVVEQDGRLMEIDMPNRKPVPQADTAPLPDIPVLDKIALAPNSLIEPVDVVSVTPSHVTEFPCGHSNKIFDYFAKGGKESIGSLNYYRPQLYYQHYLCNAYTGCLQSQTPVLLEPVEGLIMVFRHTGDVDLFGRNADQYASILVKPVVGSMAPISNLNIDQSFDVGSHYGTFSAMQLIWEITLKTSRGRLPYGTDLNRLFRLRQWPDLTRVTPIPHAVRIAAAWSSTVMALTQTVSTLALRKEYVYAFYSCAYALQLIDFDCVEQERHIKSLEESKKHLIAKFLKRLMRI